MKVLFLVVIMAELHEMESLVENYCREKMIEEETFDILKQACLCIEEDNAPEVLDLSTELEDLPFEDLPVLSPETLMGLDVEEEATDTTSDTASVVAAGFELPASEWGPSEPFEPFEPYQMKVLPTLDHHPLFQEYQLPQPNPPTLTVEEGRRQRWRTNRRTGRKHRKNTGLKSDRIGRSCDELVDMLLLKNTEMDYNEIKHIIKRLRGVAYDLRKEGQ